MPILKLKYRTILLTILMAFTHIAIGGDLGKTIASQGNGKGATACIVCHGADGAGMAAAGFPLLAGLNSAYMEKQLHDFNSANRRNSTMTSIARALSDKEIKAVAAYFANMKPAASSSQSSVDDKLMKEGKTLAEKGNWSNDVPACFACHGVGASGIGDHFPALAGQHASYIEQQIKSWRNGQRKNDPNQLMKGVAMRLSDVEIKAVSSYLASLSMAGN